MLSLEPSLKSLFKGGSMNYIFYLLMTCMFLLSCGKLEKKSATAATTSGKVTLPTKISSSAL